MISVKACPELTVIVPPPKMHDAPYITVRVARGGWGGRWKCWTWKWRTWNWRTNVQGMKMPDMKMLDNDMK